MTDKLYDLIIPPGVPKKIIMELGEKYDVELAGRRMLIDFAAMEGDVREILVFRGDLETVQKVEAEMKAKLEEFIEED